LLGGCRFFSRAWKNQKEGKKQGNPRKVGFDSRGRKGARLSGGGTTARTKGSVNGKKGRGGMRGGKSYNPLITSKTAAGSERKTRGREYKRISNRGKNDSGDAVQLLHTGTRRGSNTKEKHRKKLQPTRKKQKVARKKNGEEGQKGETPPPSLTTE